MQSAHPRSRGEHISEWRAIHALAGSSPLTRGAPPGEDPADDLLRLIPAHAGSTKSGGVKKWGPSAHPRSRGEHTIGSLFSGYGGGSSPLTRGAPIGGKRRERLQRLIPAHAGSTTWFTPTPLACTAHPRSRGEHRLTSPIMGTCPGSSPLTRGAPELSTITPGKRRLIPAHAGSTPPRGFLLCDGAAHPRSRGEHPDGRAEGSGSVGSSPLTRGAPGRATTTIRLRRLIPAHAGSTCSMIGARSAPRAHPRSRGEHKTMATARNAHLGSSPLTRGARPSKCPYRTPTGLIPAHAGSTISAPPWPEEKAAHPRSRGEH